MINEQDKRAMNGHCHPDSARPHTLHLFFSIHPHTLMDTHIRAYVPSHPIIRIYVFVHTPTSHVHPPYPSPLPHPHPHSLSFIDNPPRISTMTRAHVRMTSDHSWLIFLATPTTGKLFNRIPPTIMPNRCGRRITCARKPKKPTQLST